MAATEYTYDDDSFSDLHKDATGVRPGEGGYKRWEASTPEEKQQWWDYLIAELIRSEEREAEYERKSIEEFEAQVVKTIEVGAKNREQAIQWLMEASEWGGDVEHFCYLMGLPYNYIDKYFSEAPSNEN